MSTPRFLTALTAVNLGLFVFQLVRIPSALAAKPAPVLRGSALEIVDDQGRPRASIKIQAPGRMPDGEPYPETVMFRLIDQHGRPEVKLGASERGAGLSLVGESDVTHVLLQTRGHESSLKLTHGDGREQILKP